MHLRKERAHECYITPSLSRFTEVIQSFHELQQIKHTEQTVYCKLQYLDSRIIYNNLRSYIYKDEKYQ